MKKAIILTLIVLSLMLLGCADDGFVPAKQGQPQVSGGKVAIDFDPNASINLTQDEPEAQVGLEEVEVN